MAQMGSIPALLDKAPGHEASEALSITVLHSSVLATLTGNRNRKDLKTPWINVTLRLLVVGRDGHCVKLASRGAHLGFQLLLANPASEISMISEWIDRSDNHILEEDFSRAIGLGAQFASVRGASGGVPGHGGGEDLHVGHVPVVLHGLHHSVHDPHLVIGQSSLPQSPAMATRDMWHETRDKHQEKDYKPKKIYYFILAKSFLYQSLPSSLSVPKSSVHCTTVKHLLRNGTWHGSKSGLKTVQIPETGDDQDRGLVSRTLLLSWEQTMSAFLYLEASLRLLLHFCETLTKTHFNRR